MAYIKPQVTVAQNFTQAPLSVDREQPAFIFGPNYQLHRYENDSEKEASSVGLFKGEKKFVEYPGALDASKVDKSYTKLFGDNVVIGLYDCGIPQLPESGNSFPQSMVIANGGYTRLFFANKAFVRLDVDGYAVKREEDLKRDIVANDALLIEFTPEGSDETTTKIVTTIDAIAYSKNGFNLDNDSSKEAATPGTLITIDDVLPAGCEIVGVTLCEIQSGVEFTRHDLHTENSGVNQWTEVEADGTDAYKDDSGLPYEKGTPLVEINDDLFVQVFDYGTPGEYFKVAYADLFVTFRELLTGYSDAIHSVANASEVADVLGTVDPDNPLAQGVYQAAVNAVSDDGFTSPPTYFMAVPTDDLNGYNEVLDAATLTDVIYSLSPTTSDEAVLDAVQAHVVAMSAKDVKRWRICFVSAKVPNEGAVYSPANNTDGSNFLAVPVSTVAGTGAGGDPETYTMLRVVVSETDRSGSPNTAFRSDVKPGDTIRFRPHADAWGDKTYDTYTVKSVVNNNTVLLTKAVDVSALEHDEDGYLPVAIEVYHTYTDAEKATVIASTSKAMASRRTYNVFPPVFLSNGVQMTGEFGACAIAGRVAACLPQQPMTNLEVRGVDDVPMIYKTFNESELNVIAAGGTFIIAQDMPEDKVYIRHQISTAYPDGNINTAELSITKNVDSISYGIAQTLAPYIGKYNITPELLRVIRNVLSELIYHYEAGTTLYGPQLIAVDEDGNDLTVINYVRQNNLAKDHVDVSIRLGVPYPCNNIDVVLTI